MKIRVVHNEITNVRRIERVHKDEWELVFVCHDEYGEEHGVNHDSAVLNFSVKGTSGQVLTKTADIQGSNMTFTFADDDFDNSGHYVYQLIVTEHSLTYTLAQGELDLLEKIE